MLKTVYPQGKEPTCQLFSSSQRTAVLPLFNIYMQFFGYFSGLGNVLTCSNDRKMFFVENYFKAITLHEIYKMHILLGQVSGLLADPLQFIEMKWCFLSTNAISLLNGYVKSC